MFTNWLRALYLNTLAPPNVSNGDIQDSKFQIPPPSTIELPQKNMLQIGVAMNVIDVTFTT